MPKVPSLIRTEPALEKAHSLDILKIPGYSIHSIKGLNYIVNSKGEVVSKGYHNFQTFKVGDSVALIGELGAMKTLLKSPTNENETFQESRAQFHEINFDKENELLTCKTGSMSYVLDPMTGEKISEGYHSFFKVKGTLYGNRGALEEPVRMINPSDRLLSVQKAPTQEKRTILRSITRFFK